MRELCDVIAQLYASSLISVRVAGQHLSVYRPAMGKICKVEGGMIEMVIFHQIGIPTLHHSLLVAAVKGRHTEVEAIDRLNANACG